MSMYIGTMTIAVAGIALYHWAQKIISSDSDAFASLIGTYAVALIISLLAYPFFSKDIPLFNNLKSLGWESFFLGFTVVLIELGFLLAYRAGWDVSKASLIATAAAALLFLPFGIIYFREHLSGQNMVGVVVTLIGIILMLR